MFQKPSNTYLGILDFDTGKALGHLSDHHHVRYVASIPDEQKKNGANFKTRNSSSCDFHVIVYGFREESDAVGKTLTNDKVYLQHPHAHDELIPYDNPQYLKIPGSEIDISRVVQLQKTQPLATSIIPSIFDSAQGPHTWSEVSASRRLKTKLKMYVVPISVCLGIPPVSAVK